MEETQLFNSIDNFTKDQINCLIHSRTQEGHDYILNTKISEELEDLFMDEYSSLQVNSIKEFHCSVDFYLESSEKEPPILIERWNISLNINKNSFKDKKKSFMKEKLNECSNSIKIFSQSLPFHSLLLSQDFHPKYKIVSSNYFSKKAHSYQNWSNKVNEININTWISKTLELIPNCLQIESCYLSNNSMFQILKENKILKEESPIILNEDYMKTEINNSSYNKLKKLNNSKKEGNKESDFGLLNSTNSNKKNFGSNNNSSSNKSKPSVIIRPRFLSEDNSHPSYQVLNFHHLYLHDDYISNTSKPEESSKQKVYTNPNYKSSILKANYNTHNYQNNISKDLKRCSFKECKIKKHYINSLSKISQEKDKFEKETTSRKSTDMKSQFKSKNLDFLPEEDVSNVSFELNFECGNISEEQEDKENVDSSDLDEKPKNLDNKFCLDEVIQKANKLKEILGSKD